MKKKTPDTVVGIADDRSLEELMSEDAGKGVQRFPWLGDFVSPWVDAIEAIDKSGNKLPLVDLLRSEAPLDHDARWYLADLLDRYELRYERKNSRGIQAIEEEEKQALIALLKSDAPLDRDNRGSLSDLLIRYDLKRGRSRPGTPIYDRTPTDLRKMVAKERVDELRMDRGLTIEEAVEEIYSKQLYPDGEHRRKADAPLRWPFEWLNPKTLKVNYLSAATLLNYCKDRHGSERRKRKQDPRSKPRQV